VTAFPNAAGRDGMVAVSVIAAAVLAIVFGLTQFFAEAFGVTRASPWHWIVPVVADVALVALVMWPRGAPSPSVDEPADASAEHG
jgi:hypothetical protein